MIITLDIPEQIAARFVAAGKDMRQAALEGLAIEARRTGVLSIMDIGLLLGLDGRMNTMAFLAAHDAAFFYTEEMAKLDADASDRLQEQLRQRKPQANRAA